MGTLIPDKRGMKLMSNEPKGIGGWLVLVQIGLFLTIFTLILSVIHFSSQRLAERYGIYLLHRILTFMTRYGSRH